MAATPEIEQAAKQAAESIRRIIVEMLTAGQTGEAAIVVGYHGLDPEKRVTERKRTIRVARGQMTAIEPAR